MYSDFVDFIEKTLHLVSGVALKYQNKVGQTVATTSIKGSDNNQVLTQADLEIGQIIVSEIQKKFPDHNVIDEEAGVIDNQSTLTWVVDPIDGTSNFDNGLPTYGCMIGLLENNNPVAGGIILPNFDELFLGGKNVPATKNGKLISISSEPSLLNSLVAYGVDGHQEDPSKTYEELRVLAEIILAIRNLRTTNSAYDMGKTIEGKYGLFLNKTTKIWDNVALQAVIEAAGGICTDFYGNTLDYTNHLKKTQDNFTICAGAPQLHSQVQAIIANHAKHV